MNRVFTSVWNHNLAAWVVASEYATHRGKRGGSARRTLCIAGGLGLSLLSAGFTRAANLPTGGEIVLGTGQIGASSSNQMVIEQGGSQLAINWQSFDIGAGQTVTFNQPNRDAIALNRVLGNDGSTIMGQLQANGRVFVINPNGVLFGAGAEVNVGGLVASTLDLSVEDFAAGNYQFKGDAANRSVVNRGVLKASDGGAIALLGGTVSNAGVIVADQGSVALAAGNAVTLDFAGDGLLNLQVDQATLGALVENRQFIKADGGQVLLSANAGEALLRTVVNNTGVIEAHTLGEKNGKIVLLGDFEGGTVQVAGTLDASAPTGGNGGFVETSGAHVTVADGTRVTTLSPQGDSGTWLIDPTDFTVSAGNASPSSSGIGAATLTSNLATTSVTLATVASGSDAGDIHLNAAVSWSANTLTLSAHNDININADLNASGTGKLALNYGQGAAAAGNTAGYYLNSGARVNLPAGQNFSTTQGSDGSTTTYTVITALGSAGSTTGSNLQGINGDLSRNYALGADIDASATASWNAGQGFSPIGSFTNTFDGLGHVISGLSITRPAQPGVGLFYQLDTGGTLRNIGLQGGSVTGQHTVGSLVGVNKGTLSNVYTTSAVTGELIVGGLVGNNDGSINNAYASGAVTGTSFGIVGGLAGVNYGFISNAYVTGTVNGNDRTGGLVGSNVGTISNAYATAAVSIINQNMSQGDVGGLVGYNSPIATVTDSYFAINDADDNVINNAGFRLDFGYGTHNGNAYGQDSTLETLSKLTTFTHWDIDANGGTGSVWRIYEGDTTPLLSSFLKPISVIAAVSNTTYDGQVIAVAGASYTQDLTGVVLDGSLNYSTSSANAGTYSTANGGLTLNGLYSDQQGYDISYTPTSLTIAQKGLTLTGATAGNKTYDGDAAATVTGGTLNGLIGTETLTLSGLTASFNNKNAGAGKLVTVTDAGLNDGTNGGLASNYILANPSGLAADILQASLLVTANDASKGYDGLAFSGGNGLSYSGFINGEDDSVLGGSLNYGGSGQGAINAGSYLINASGLSADNYALSYADGTLTVNKAAATVTANSDITTYNGLLQTMSGFTASGLVNGETSSVLSGVSATASGINAGTYSVIASGTDSNYELSFVDGLLSINKAAATVTASSDTTTYNGLLQRVESFTASGLVNGETGSVLSGVTVAGGGTNAGTYSVVASGVDANYALTFVDGALTINKAAATVTANSDTTYNGQLQYAAGFIASGLVNGETESVLSGVTVAGSGTNAGTYSLVASGVDANYQLTFVDGALTINKAAATVTANSDTTYNGQLQYAAGFTASGLVNGETESVLSGVTVAGSGINAGTYRVVASGVDTNYALSFVDSALTINKAAATITANSSTTLYNGQRQSVSGFTASGLVNGETSSVLSGVTASGSGIGAGTYASVVSGTDANYALTLVDGVLRIDRAPLLVTASDLSTTYTGDRFFGGNGVSYSGFVAGESAEVLDGSLVYSGNAQGAIDFGRYALIAGGLGSNNYALSYVGGSLQIVASRAALLNVQSSAQQTAFELPPRVNAMPRSVATQQQGTSLFDIAHGGIRLPEGIEF